MMRWFKLPSSLFKRGSKFSQKIDHCSATLAVKSASKCESSPLFGTTDRYYIASTREMFKDGRYEAIRQLGGGRYSQVWLAKDLQENRSVALKLLTNDCYGTDHDIFEVEILRKVTNEHARLTGASRSRCITLLDTFQIKGPNGMHECIVMPIVGSSIMDQAMRFADKRIPVSIMKTVTRQLLQGLSFLHDTCRVIHTDLHPSNICLEIDEDLVQKVLEGQSISNVTPTMTEEQPGNIKIIDFSVAGYLDFEDDHLAQYMEVLGAMPPRLLESAARTAEFFDDKGNLLRIPSLQQTNLRRFLDGKEGPLKRPKNMTSEDISAFVDFLQGALALDPHDRKTAKELLRHEWLHQNA
ncbi:kinase-like protein [Pseudovirgaria hyperparasitica]|uniref:non-specific serine/threonine protein kinase n=1 Tax=Pseudovirgaria hyperparasitica TaxID=470096 RepID=A0A6A6W7H5_9PEZI|nr:kinase-like protein [Pseudovirgaria hyperparasitica]KAF2758583.1 kinase-like protein [Pseudovirgaria hyperparasitica]